ncbi:unnamed protein product [Orchesella dallaii]|uniref:Uncharacterized protein n=1 Tax=Orchesella dallaii TaxID=48710 RepID=A0ABP1RWP9_9HEXA
MYGLWSKKRALKNDYHDKAYLSIPSSAAATAAPTREGERKRGYLLMFGGGKKSHWELFGWNHHVVVKCQHFLVTSATTKKGEATVKRDREEATFPVLASP